MEIMRQDMMTSYKTAICKELCLTESNMHKNELTRGTECDEYTFSYVCGYNCLAFLGNDSVKLFLIYSSVP